jgi:quercetin dioxygenase-like cupin family protein
MATNDATEWVNDPVLDFSVSFERHGQNLIINTRARPGGGPPPHVHPNGDERFAVERGQVEFLLGRRKQVVGPGEEVTVPRGTKHAFKNIGTEEAIFQAEVIPETSGTGEDFFREAAAAAERGMYTRRGIPKSPRAALHLMRMLERYQDFVLTSNPPPAVQRLLFPVARRFGS